MTIASWLFLLDYFLEFLCSGIHIYCCPSQTFPHSGSTLMIQAALMSEKLYLLHKLLTTELSLIFLAFNP